MNIELIPVKVENKQTLINLYQLYEYDFSKYTHLDVNVDGRFEVNIDYYWEGDERWQPFFIKTASLKCTVRIGRFHKWTIIHPQYYFGET